jgi:hypothetical protein
MTKWLVKALSRETREVINDLSLGIFVRNIMSASAGTWIIIRMCVRVRVRI